MTALLLPSRHRAAGSWSQNPRTRRGQRRAARPGCPAARPASRRSARRRRWPAEVGLHVGRQRQRLADVVRPGRQQHERGRAPDRARQAAEAAEDRPPVSSATDSAAGTRPGAASERDHRRAARPPGPAHAALTTNASTCVRATWMPASCGGDLVVAHRPERPPEPAAHEVGEQHVGDQRGQAARSTPASARAGTSRRAPAGGVGGVTVSPFDAPRNVGNRCASAGSPTASASVAPARYGPRSRAAAAPASAPTTAATSAARQQRDGQRPPAGVPEQLRRRVGADRHQRAVAERDLPVEPGQHGQPGDRDEVVRHRRELQVVDTGRARPVSRKQRDARARAAIGQVAQRASVDRSRRSHPLAACANSPFGRTISTATRITSAPSVTTSAPQ